MRYVMLLMCSGALMGCASTGTQQPNLWNKWFAKSEKPQVQIIPNQSTLPNIEVEPKVGFSDQYYMGKFSLGSWVNQKPGQLFQPVKTTHPDAALIYLYRTDSRWNRQEIIPMNFQLNGERIPSLLNNHYYWIELPAGTYRLNMSRPAGVAHFQKPKMADFTVQAGKTYYLRYEEQKFKGSPDESLGLFKLGALMQVPTAQGQKEIKTTQLKTAGLSFVKYDEQLAQGFADNIHQDQYKKVSKSDLSEKEQIVLKKPFSLFNPLTW